jgi:dihydrofolate reductase
MIGIIAAVSSNGVVGQNGTLPWSYPEDLKYFKQQTLNSTIIMGRSTFESIGSKGLPKRGNIVLSSSLKNGDFGTVGITSSFDGAITVSKMWPNDKKDTWIIGGTNIWREGMKYADTIRLTLIPEVIEGDNLTYFPWIDPKQFELSIITPMPCETGESKLSIAIYNKIR